MSEPLKPCPTCGKAAILDELFDQNGWGEPAAYWAHCYEGWKDCPKQNEVVRKTEAEAITAWNTRRGE